MENGYESLRKIEKLCKTDIRFMWLLQDEPPPSHMTIDNFMNNVLNGKIEEIFADINAYIFEQENVDMDHVYIDGTKITANANKYSWVWKKSCEKNRVKVFAKITELLSEINKRIAAFGVKFGVREEYAIEYLEQILKQYIQLCGFAYYNSTLNSKTNIASVEETAGRLGLMKVDPSQITYIRLGESGALVRRESTVRQWTDFLYTGAVNILGTVR